MSRLTFYCVTIFSLLLLCFNCGRDPAADQTGDRPLVVTSIVPLADFARQVGGENIRVSAIVPPGASPHTYEPKPSQLEQLSHAQVLILNGIGLEYWADKLISAADNPDLFVVVASSGQEIIEGHEHGHEGKDQEHVDSGNPHVWLSPRCAMLQVKVIRDALIKIDPDRSESYRVNAKSFLDELMSLDREIMERVAAFSTRRFVAFHVAWSYFARDYGLEQAAVIERTPGHEPSPGEIAAIIQTARSINAKAIFAEPQFSPRAADTIAEESGAMVLFLNPLGIPPENRYLDLMRYNLHEISKALE